MIKHFSCVLLLFFAVSCSVNTVFEEYFSIKKKTDKGTPVARVHDDYLYEEDIRKILSPEVSVADSIKLADIYVDSWIKKHLKLKVAKENTAIDEEEIEQKVQEYKYQLILYGFEKKYINRHLDSAISLEEIRQYYQENTADFELKQNIVRCIFVKIPKEMPNLLNVPKWLRSNRVKEIEKLKIYAYTYADIYQLDDSTWLDFDNLIRYTPFANEINNQIQTLQRKKILQTTDSLFNYYLKILDYKITDQISPLPYVQDRIRNILTNKRKIALRKKLQEDIYREATKNNHYEIYKK